MKLKTIQERARMHRQNPTKAEAFFWDKVRNKQMNGFRFNRQYIFKYRKLENIDLYFILDFICFEKKLIIEIDGEYHNKIAEYDYERDSIIKTYGWNILHYTNDDVLNRWQKVQENLLTKLLDQ